MLSFLISTTATHVAGRQDRTHELRCASKWHLTTALPEHRKCDLKLASVMQRLYSHFGLNSHFLAEKATCRILRQEGLVVSPDKKKFEVGETASFSCQPGYVLKGLNSSTCQKKERSWGFMRGEFSPRIRMDLCESA